MDCETFFLRFFFCDSTRVQGHTSVHVQLGHSGFRSQRRNPAHHFIYRTESVQDQDLLTLSTWCMLIGRFDNQQYSFSIVQTNASVISPMIAWLELTGFFSLFLMKHKIEQAVFDSCIFTVVCCKYLFSTSIKSFWSKNHHLTSRKVSGTATVSSGTTSERRGFMLGEVRGNVCRSDISEYGSKADTQHNIQWTVLEEKVKMERGVGSVWGSWRRGRCAVITGEELLGWRSPPQPRLSAQTQTAPEEEKGVGEERMWGKQGRKESFRPCPSLQVKEWEWLAAASSSSRYISPDPAWTRPNLPLRFQPDEREQPAPALIQPGVS